MIQQIHFLLFDWISDFVSILNLSKIPSKRYIYRLIAFDPNVLIN